MIVKTTAISIVIAAVLIGGAIVFAGDNKSSNADTLQATNNVSIVGGKQIITINAKGSYSPKVTTARADMPTVLKVATNGTFDCTAMLAIPSLGYKKNLPPSGETLIDVPSQKAGTIMRGICGMGMYNFSINFN